MSESSNILREYLVSLGFKIDEVGGKKVDTHFVNLDKKALGLAKAVMGVGTAITGMVMVFTYQMEKLYYASKRTDSAVGSIQAMEFAGKQIGISADTMRGALEGMARALRGNPGLTGLLNSLGVRVQGRDKADVMSDLVEQLSKMPFATAKSIGSLFGVDEDTLFMLIQGKDEYKKMMQARKDMAADAGVDLDAAAKASKEYANSLGSVYEKLGMVKDIVAIKLLPSFQAFTTAIDANLTVLIKWMGKFKSLGDMVDGLIHTDPTKAPKPSGQRTLTDFLLSSPAQYLEKPITPSAQPVAPPKKKGFWDFLRSSPGDVAAPPAGAPPASQTQAPAQMSKADRLRALEAKYGLPDGLLDKVWKRESGRGKHMLSPAGAKGHFGFMDPTAAEYKVKDPNDFDQSSEGAAHMWSDLLKQYKGDVRKAAGAYNYGSGNMARLPLGYVPKETRDYQDAIGGPAPPAITQTNHITVTGVSDPAKAAAEVSRAQQVTNADLVRQFKPRYQ